MKKLVLVLALLSLVGCTSSLRTSAVPEGTPTLPGPAVTTIAAPDEELAATRFLDAWKAQDYDTMFGYLTPAAQESVGREGFAERYNMAQRALALSSFDYQIVSSLVNPQAAQVRYRLTFHSSILGDMTRETWMDLQRFEDEWKIAWSETAILPELAGGNGLVLNTVTPTRANIYDRQGLALAMQGDIAALWLVPNEIGDPENEALMLRSLSRLLKVRTGTIQSWYEPFRQTSYWITLGEVPLEDFQEEQDILNSVSAVYWVFYTGRHYIDGGLAPHAVGYVAQIQQEELDEYLNLGYRGDEFVGQIGIEASYEDELRGVPGGSLYLTDPAGQALELLASSDTQPPYAVYTTLDRSLQGYAQRAIEEFRGAIVVLERDTGAVLAMVSSPGFDPDLFDAHNPNSSPGLTELFGRGGQPLYNRATHGAYALGSTFKIITMSAALESGFYTPASTYVCEGEFRELEGFVLHDWTVAKELPPHGELTLMEGLERSCNPYFWHIGLDLYNRGLQTALPDMAKAFGLGKPTGIEIGEAAGQVPDPDWKQLNLGASWGPGDAVQLAIGQASLTVTPLQAARFVAAVGNGGTLYRPQIIDHLESGEGEIIDRFAPIVDGQLPVSAENLQAIQQAMVQVVRERHGTARLRFMGLDINVAGKTGTAESGAEDPHAWFLGYTFEGREDKPDIAVAVLVENQGEGSEWAAPIFRRVVEAYFYGRPITLYAWESQIGVRRTATPTPGPEEPTPEGTPNP